MWQRLWLDGSSSQVLQKLIARKTLMQGFAAGSGCSDNRNSLLVLWVSHELRERRKNSKSFGIVSKALARVEETVQLL